MYSLHKEQRQLTKKILLGLSIGVFSILPVMPVAGASSVTATTLPNEGAYAAVNAATASITTANNTMTVTGKKTNNILKWQDFSIGSSGTVNFDSNNYLNLVNGSTKSEIYGTLTGGGNVYLINPNGVLFGSTAKVSVSGILGVSTRPIADVDQTSFSSGGSPLSGTASSLSGDIINQGKIQATSVKLEGDDIVLTRTDNITSDGTTALSDVSLTANGNIDIGYAYNSSTKKATTTKGSEAGYSANKTINDCQLISTASELEGISGSNNYMLGSDIDLSGESNFSSLNLSKLLIDGAGYSIKNLTSSTNGLFTSLNNSTVRHLNLSIKLTNASKNVGGLAGQTTNTNVDDVHVTGTITGDGSAYQIGGIIGNATNGTISDSSAAVNITNVKSKTGGIVGRSSAALKNVINTGNITGVSGSQYIGGIVGISYGGVANASNTGTITAGKNSGGIVGELESSSAYVTSSYNAGDITGTFAGGKVGGIVGSAKAGSINNVYNTGTVTDSTGAAYGIAGNTKDSVTITNSYTTSGTVSDGKNVTNSFTGDDTDLTKSSNFSGWDTSIWDIAEGQRPRLKAFLHTQDLTGATNLTTYTYNGSEQTTSAGSNYGFGDTVTITASGTNAGTYTSTSATDTSDTGYIFTGNANFVIDKAKLLVNVSDATMTYGSSDITYTDGSTTGYTIDSSSLKGSDTLSSIQDSDHVLKIALTNNALASTEEQAAGKVTKDAGTYSLEATDGGSTLQNYYVATGTAGTVTVNKANLTATVNDISTTYGTAFNNADCLTVSGLVNGDTADTLGVAFKNTSEADGTNGRVTQDVGTYTIEADVSASNNYNITLTTGTNTANAYVTKASLNLDNLTVKDSSTSADVTTTYGTAFNTANYTVASTDSKATGFVNGDTIESLGLAYSNTGAADGTNGKYTQDVGTYTITTTLDADKLSNYEITGSGNTVTGTSTVTPATLTLTAAAVTGVPAGWAETTGYTTDTTSGTTSLTPYTGSVSGYVNGDTSSILDGATVTFTSTAPSTAGTYALTGSINGSTSRFGNYYLVQADSNSSALTIVANTASAPLTRTEIPVYSNIITAVSTSGAGSATAVPGEAAPQALTVAVTSDLSATDSTSTEADTTVNAKTSTSSPNVSNSKSILTVVD